MGKNTEWKKITKKRNEKETAFSLIASSYLISSFFFSISFIFFVRFFGWHFKIHKFLSIPWCLFVLFVPYCSVGQWSLFTKRNCDTFQILGNLCDRINFFHFLHFFFVYFLSLLPMYMSLFVFCHAIGSL